MTSADGFAKTYAVPSSVSVSTVKAGDTVVLVASGTTLSALLDPQRMTPATRPTAPSTTRPSTPPSAPASGGATAPESGRPAFGGPGAGLLGRVLHGTFVATGATATTYVTDVVQSGAVTAVSATSVSLRSADGYTASYVLGSATKKLGTVASGDQVTVTATGSPATATTVLAVPTAGGWPGGFGGYGPGLRPGGRPSGAPTPPAAFGDPGGGPISPEGGA